MDKITGKWIGEYMYGNLYPKEWQGKVVTFELDLTFSEGKITGTCVDDDTKDHFSEPAIISGFIRDNYINFIKKYPYFNQINEDLNGIDFKQEQPSQEINYTGRFENGIFIGDWEIISTYKDSFGRTQKDLGNGSWSMHKL
ncbi:MAG TPA: hypothetical protein VNT20_18325 [Flavisolibacter sp.]|nr:hypothetical protein [Flavisolibacter sp.]